MTDPLLSIDATGQPITSRRSLSEHLISPRSTDEKRPRRVTISGRNDLGTLNEEQFSTPNFTSNERKRRQSFSLGALSTDGLKPTHRKTIVKTIEAFEGPWFYTPLPMQLQDIAAYPLAQKLALDGDCTFWLWLSVYVVASLLLLFRAICIGISTHWDVPEFAKAMGPIFVYVCVWVLIPVAKVNLTMSKPFYNINIHRQYYRDLTTKSFGDHTSMAMWSNISYYSRHPLNILGLIAPSSIILISWDAWSTGHSIASVIDACSVTKVPVGISMITALSSYGTVWLGASVGLSVAVDASLVAATGLLSEITKIDPSHDTSSENVRRISHVSDWSDDAVRVEDSLRNEVVASKADEIEVFFNGEPFEFENNRPWHMIAKQHVALDCLLEKLWRFDCAGGLWLLRVLLLFLSSFVFAALSAMHSRSDIGQIPSGRRPLSLLACSICLACIGSHMLYRVADVTNIFVSDIATSRSIKAATYRFLGQTFGESDVIPMAYNAYLRYLQSHSTGIRIFGILVTKRLVWFIFINTAINLPVALSFWMKLFDEKTSNEEPP